jgi:hypothetical protein
MLHNLLLTLFGSGGDQFEPVVPVESDERSLIVPICPGGLGLLSSD